MNLILEKENFDDNNIYLGEPIKNTVMSNSSFIRIFYSDHMVILNGIYLKIIISNINFKSRLMDDFYNKSVLIFIEN